MTGTSPVIFRQTENTLLLSGQQEHRKTGPQAELHHRQVKSEILCNDPAGQFWGLLGEGESLFCSFFLKYEEKEYDTRKGFKEVTLES